MDLHNTLPHMRGKSVLVNGTKYALDGNGVARDVADRDADKLLRRAQGAWRVYAERQPVQGQKAPAEPSEGDAAAPAPDSVAVQGAQDQTEAPGPGQEDSASNEWTQNAEGLAARDTAGGQDVAPLVEDAGDDGELQPDPSMEIEDLRQMADAYDAAYSADTSKETLVERIKQAMQE